MHPYEDEQFLAEHPEVKGKAKSSTTPDGLDPDAPPSYDVATEGRAPERIEKGKSDSGKHYDSPDAGPSTQTEHKRGVFERLRDKAIGTKEEREEHKRIRAEQAAQAEERARQARVRELEERKERKRIKAERAAEAEERAHRARLRELEEREAYMRAYGGYAPYQPSYGPRPAYGPYGTTTQGGGLGGDTAALLLGGLAGGLLLGDIFGGGGGFF